VRRRTLAYFGAHDSHFEDKESTFVTHSHELLIYTCLHSPLWCTVPIEEAAPVTSNPIEDIHGYDQRVDVEADPMVHTYGTYGLGMDLTAAAWPGLLQVFTGGDSKVYDSVSLRCYFLQLFLHRRRNSGKSCKICRCQHQQPESGFAMRSLRTPRNSGEPIKYRGAKMRVILVTMAILAERNNQP
jgi:hypothetical protein